MYDARCFTQRKSDSIDEIQTNQAESEAIQIHDEGSTAPFSGGAGSWHVALPIVVVPASIAAVEEGMLRKNAMWRRLRRLKQKIAAILNYQIV